MWTTENIKYSELCLSSSEIHTNFNLNTSKYSLSLILPYTEPHYFTKILWLIEACFYKSIWMTSNTTAISFLVKILYKLNTAEMVTSYGHLMQRQLFITFIYHIFICVHFFIGIVFSVPWVGLHDRESWEQSQQQILQVRLSFLFENSLWKGKLSFPENLLLD